MRLSAAIVMTVWFAACATGIPMESAPNGDSGQPGGSGGGSGSGSGSGSDNTNSQGSGSDTDPTDVPLLLSEISLGPAGHEFVEIVNPSAFAVPLKDLYLCDNGNYFKLPAGGATLQSGDFLVRFPDNDIVPAHGVITVALGASTDFNTAFGSNPTYSIADGTITVVSSMTPTLTDTGEVVILFQWDGSAPVVRDVDIMIAGAPTAANTIVSKSDYSQLTSAYKVDLMSIGPQAATPAAGKSTKRIALETGHETQTGGGNGVDGDDETSEATGTTWDSSAFTVPTPGQVPAALLQ
jgi:hypothetical protein